METNASEVLSANDNKVVQERDGAQGQDGHCGGCAVHFILIRNGQGSPGITAGLQASVSERGGRRSNLLYVPMLANSQSLPRSPCLQGAEGKVTGALWPCLSWQCYYPHGDPGLARAPCGAVDQDPRALGAPCFAEGEAQDA